MLFQEEIKWKWVIKNRPFSQEEFWVCCKQQAILTAPSKANHLFQSLLLHEETKWQLVAKLGLFCEKGEVTDLKYMFKNILVINFLNKCAAIEEVVIFKFSKHSWNIWSMFFEWVGGYFTLYQISLSQCVLFVKFLTFSVNF